MDVPGIYNTDLNAPRDPWYRNPLLPGNVAAPQWLNGVDSSPLPWQLGQNSSFGGAPGNLKLPTVAGPYGSLGAYAPSGTATGSTGGGGWAGTQSGGQPNPTETLRNSKNPAIDSAIQNLLGNYTTTSTGSKSAVQTYLDSLKESVGTTLSNYNRDQGTLNERLSGGVLQRQLGDLNDREARLRALEDRITQHDRALTSSDAIRSGGGNRGLGSWVREASANRLTDRLLPLQLEQSDLGRAYRDQDYAARLGLVGAPTQLQDTYLNRAFLGPDAARRQYGLDASLLAPISQLDLANTFYSTRMPNTAAGSSLYSGFGASPNVGRPNKLPLPPGYGGGGGYLPNGFGGGTGGGGFTRDGIVYTDPSMSRINYQATNAANFARNIQANGTPRSPYVDYGMPNTPPPSYLQDYPMAPVGDYNYEPGTGGYV